MVIRSSACLPSARTQRWWEHQSAQLNSPLLRQTLLLGDCLGGSGNSISRWFDVDAVLFLHANLFIRHNIQQFSIEEFLPVGLTADADFRMNENTFFPHSPFAELGIVRGEVEHGQKSQVLIKASSMAFLLPVSELIAPLIPSEGEEREKYSPLLIFALRHRAIDFRRAPYPFGSGVAVERVPIGGRSRRSPITGIHDWDP